MLLEGLFCKVRFRGTKYSLSCTQHMSCLCPHPVPEGCLEAFLEDASLSPTVLHPLGLNKLFTGREEQGLVSFWKGDLLCISGAGSLHLLPPPNPLPGGRAMATRTRSLPESPRGQAGAQPTSREIAVPVRLRLLCWPQRICLVRCSSGICNPRLEEELSWIWCLPFSPGRI